MNFGIYKNLSWKERMIIDLAKTRERISFSEIYPDIYCKRDSAEVAIKRLVKRGLLLHESNGIFSFVPYLKTGEIQKELSIEG